MFVLAPDDHWIGPDVLIETLETAGQFMPARDPETRDFLLLGTDQIRWLAISSAGMPLDDPDLLFDINSPVRLELCGGTNAAGSFLYSAPAAHARLLDHLNDRATWVVLHAGERLMIINKRQIVRVSERRNLERTDAEN
ncbi:MAG: hypothetical protein H6707_04295 [Deltaproteobacteria bacterium]|nr:hypothetical protein [Deltaproteobacteria bacterium]